MEHGQPTSDNTAIKMIPSPPVAFNWQQPLRGGTSWAPSPSMLEFHLTWSFTGLVKVTSAYEFMTAICMSFKENTISEHSSQPLVHTFFLPPLLCSLSVGQEIDKDVPIRGWVLTDTCYQHFEQLWFSTLTDAKEKEKEEEAAAAALIYRYKHRYLEGNMIISQNNNSHSAICSLKK